MPILKLCFPGNILSIAVLIFSSSLFVGCSEEKVSISLSGLNYTDRNIINFTVNGYSGANVRANGGGGSFVCCVTIPNKWRDDLNVTVRWADNSAHPEHFKEKIVKVPPYADGDFGTFVVHFYPNDVVKVLVTTKTAEHPNYPYPRPTRNSLDNMSHKNLFLQEQPLRARAHKY
ncbi:DUF3304 domain-containing protein [Pseudoduganella buxea]|uniref:DUF3304 domain-containing protein n=1 Tax=Pseudoduganella buxea TaxID=1949069 RepID=A0A6I3T386_9BURK|nr:DUF3304 domain-containing protein [Pseudoduganella buxea]